jgi:DNA ligase (NAD+)
MEQSIKTLLSKKNYDTEFLSTLHRIKLYVDDKYYNSGKQTGLTDSQYDLLKETLEKRDPTYIPPVGSKIRYGDNRTKLSYWLGSMDKIKPEEVNKIERWISKNKKSDYIVEDKLDGVSCLLEMKNGNLKLFTRGDGIVGADISYLARYFNSIPKNLTDIVVRGELIMEKDVFEKKYSKDNANARNMVAGRIGGKTVRYGLTDIIFVAYEIVGHDLRKKPSLQLDDLVKLGFTTVRNQIVTTLEPEYLYDILKEFKGSSKYEIDGIIIQVNSSYIRNNSGNPDYAFAFKSMTGDSVVSTVVEEVEWNVSMWGLLKPRVKIKPVVLSGVKITYASGFNAKFIRDNCIGPCSVINITRSGDVIPYIVNVIKQTRAQMPKISYEWNESGVDIRTDEFEDIASVKMTCSFFSKLGIKYVSIATVKKMYEHGLSSIFDIISADKKDFQEIDTFEEKSVDRIYDNIHNGLQNVSLPTVLGASGVFGYGMGRKKITLLFESIPNLFELHESESVEYLKDMILKVEGFSEKSATKIIEHVKWANIFIKDISKFATFKVEEKISNDLSLKKYVMSGFRDIDMEQEIKKRGGKVVTSVSKNTTGVIVLIKSGEPTGKVKKALSLGVEVYTKEEFKKKFL